MGNTARGVDESKFNCFAFMQRKHETTAQGEAKAETLEFL